MPSSHSEEPRASSTRPRRRRPRLLRASLVAVTTLFAVAVAQVPAHADYLGSVTYVCAGNEVQNFAPPLTNTVEDHVVHVQATLSCTVHTSTGNENFTHLSYDYFTPPIAAGCTVPASLGLGTHRLVWHFATDPLNRGNSTYRYERTATVVNGNPVHTTNGDLTDGMFQGATGVGESTILATDQLTDCLLGEPVDQLSGPATFTALKVL